MVFQKKYMKEIVFCCGFLLFFTQASYAAGIGEMAESLLGPLGYLTSIVNKICYVIGFTLIVGSGMQYKRYRDNPTEVRLGQVLMLLIFGIIVVILPLIPEWLSGKTIGSL